MIEVIKKIFVKISLHFLNNSHYIKSEDPLHTRSMVTFPIFSRIKNILLELFHRFHSSCSFDALLLRLIISMLREHSSHLWSYQSVISVFIFERNNLKMGNKSQDRIDNHTRDGDRAATTSSLTEIFVSLDSSPTENYNDIINI